MTVDKQSYEPSSHAYSKRYGRTDKTVKTLNDEGLLSFLTVRACVGNLTLKQ